MVANSRRGAIAHGVQETDGVGLAGEVTDGVPLDVCLSRVSLLLIGFVLGLGCDRGVEVVPDACCPDQEAGQGGSEGSWDAVDAGAHGGYGDGRADQGGYGIQAASEDCRDPPDQDITDRPAANTGDGSEDDGRYCTETVLQGFGRAGHAEQAQPGGIEEIDRQGEPPQ
jgi:hypothetical protein